MNTESLKVILLFLSPLFVGGFVWWLKPAVMLSYSTRFDQWVSAQKEKTAGKEGYLSVYFIHPVLAAVAKLSEWTGKIVDDYGRCGARIALYLYFVVALGALAYVAVVVVLFVIGLLMLWGILWFLDEVFGDQEEHTEQSPRSRSTSAFADTATELEESEPGVMGLAVGKGELYAGTNWLNEHKVGSVDDAGNIVKGSNWLNEEQVGNIDSEGRIFNGTSWINKEQVGSVDADGNIYEGVGWANKQQVGRIDEDGNVYEGVGWLNEKQVGRVKPKE